MKLLNCTVCIIVGYLLSLYFILVPKVVYLMNSTLHKQFNIHMNYISDIPNNSVKGPPSLRLGYAGIFYKEIEIITNLLSSLYYMQEYLNRNCTRCPCNFHSK